MVILSDSIEIKATAERVFEWFIHLDENYQAWHPDHVACRWLSGVPGEIGAVLYSEEYLHGSLHKLKFRLTGVTPNRKIAYRTLFPESMLFPSGTFEVKPEGDVGVLFTATMCVRFGAILSKLAAGRVKALKKRHMREEGENLKGLMEAI